MTVAIITRDVVGERMAGPGIRAWHLAQELSRSFDTLLVARLEAVDALGSHGFRTLPFGSIEARNAMQRARVIVGQPIPEMFVAPKAKLVFDLFDPLLLELDQLYRNSSRLRGLIHKRIERHRLTKALRRGDALIAATPQQRAFYSAFWSEYGDANAGWQQRWMEVPFGIEERDPSDDGTPVDLGPEPVVIWSGGVWPWLDADTALRAVRDVRARGTKCRLLFLGTSHPNREVVRAGASEERSSADEDAVSWNDTWMPYRERSRWLRSSRLAAILHRKTPEAEYSIRTRLFDALWCSLPVVASRGGWAAELVEREGLGIVVEPENLQDASAAFEKLIGDDVFHAGCVSNIERVRGRFFWSRVVSPLVEKIAEWER